MDVFINSMGGILTLCLHVPNTHVVHELNILRFYWSVTYTSAKLEKKKKTEAALKQN